MKYVSIFSGLIVLALCTPAFVSAATVDVSITSTGYVPQIVTIAPGDTVRWTNNDLTTPTRGVNSDPHDTHSDYPALDFDDIAQHDTVQLTFPEQCVRHGYHDHEKDEDEGAIIVTGVCGKREPDKPIFWGVATTKISQAGALVEWSTERGSYTQIAYGTKSGTYDITSSADDMLTKYHRAELTGLLASTTYYYHTVGGMGMDQKFTSDEYRFTTLPVVVQAPVEIPAPPPVPVATTTPEPLASTSMPMMDMPGMTHHHTGMGVRSAYAIRTVHSLKFPNDLQFGDKGNGVHSLQEWLIAKKLLGEEWNTGYFGPLTKKAVIAYQKSMGIIPTGYFGWVTRQMVDTMGD